MIEKETLSKSVSYTHLDVYKRQVSVYITAVAIGDVISKIAEVGYNLSTYIKVSITVWSIVSSVVRGAGTRSANTKDD